MKKEIEFTDSDNGISDEHEYNLCNILETHTCRNFLNKILYDKCTYSIDAIRAIKAYNYLSQFYELPKYY